MREEFVWLIIGMAVVTYLTRCGCLVLFRKSGVPAWLERWLKHIPTAVLTSLIVPALLMPQGQLDLTWHNHYLLAGIVATVFAFRSRSIITTLATGMGTMLALRLFAF